MSFKKELHWLSYTEIVNTKHGSPLAPEASFCLVWFQLKYRVLKRQGYIPTHQKTRLAWKFLYLIIVIDSSGTRVTVI